jgi:hypothetical protein
MAEEPTLREAPEPEYEAPTKSEYEPDPDRLCEFTFLHRYSNMESKIVNCDLLADYRIVRYSDRKTLIPDGEASNPRHWKPEVFIEYYCRKHFDQKYRYATPPTPRITFVKIERPS